MNVDNVKSQMRKGMLEYCIMLLLHKEPAYASDIIQKLKEARLIVVEGTLYPLLTRLKNDDLLGYEWIESTQGPPRKYYRLIPAALLMPFYWLLISLAAWKGFAQIFTKPFYWEKTKHGLTEFTDSCKEETA